LANKIDFIPKRLLFRAKALTARFDLFAKLRNSIELFIGRASSIKVANVESCIQDKCKIITFEFAGSSRQVKQWLIGRTIEAVIAGKIDIGFFDGTLC
jgi:hypothetical protein